VIGVNSSIENSVLFGNNFRFYIFVYIYIKQVLKRRVMSETKLTTVKILKDVYSKFKKISFDSNVTLQKIVNRSLEKYTTDDEFKNQIDSYTNLQASGSQF